MIDALSAARAAIAADPVVDFVVRVILLIVVALVADWIITAVLRRVARRTAYAFDDLIIDGLHRPIVAGIILLGVRLQLHLLDLNDLYPQAEEIASRTLLTLFLIVVAAAAIRILKGLSDAYFAQVADRTGLDTQLHPLSNNLIVVATLLALALGVLSVWEVDLAPLLASAGIAGLAVALAAQETLANFFGGISIFLDGNYRVGDYIVLDSGERGEVAHIGIRTTTLLTRDDVQITVPNSTMASSKVTNQSAPARPFRVRIAVGVAYDSDVDEVVRLLEETALEHEDVLADPAPRARFRSFGDSSLDFELLAWVRDPALRGLASHDMGLNVLRAFRAHGVEIPFPQRDVTLVAQPTGDGS